ncbi:Bgt-2062 [Blumeria graminis f. sp. tritici]|uniref:Bgt-2062 n=1 Tax=Blumeria graminis f. sp. tritici TaxID=62690 RepID=A0A9X9MH42_BLUGR|nr:Bgt-2062 [Blumeria graminis f. sp. tritici]
MDAEEESSTCLTKQGLRLAVTYNSIQETCSFSKSSVTISQPSQSLPTENHELNWCNLTVDDKCNSPIDQELVLGWDTGLEKKLERPNSATCRVFPIRSVVNVDLSRAPSGLDDEPNVSEERLSSSRMLSLDNANCEHFSHYYQSRAQIQNDTQQRDFDVLNESIDNKKSACPLNVNTFLDQEVPEIASSRFKHVYTSDGHGVITGISGNTMQQCEDEPIHTPGAIQSFGLLVALKETSDNKFSVRVVSENSQQIIGYTPQELFNLKNFIDILSKEQEEDLLDYVSFVREERTGLSANGPSVFTIFVEQRELGKENRKLWCAMHINPNRSDLIICEFELYDDRMCPPLPLHEYESPEVPEDTLKGNPTKEEFDESTKSLNQPLRIPRSARKPKGEVELMNVFNLVSQVQQQLDSAETLETFLKILVGVVKELTSFHRVMVYKFDSSFNGRVISELVDPRATRDLYKGLNFPASDIPPQARDLYKINKVRLLYDRDNITARLLCCNKDEVEEPLDLSFSYLRAMSPVHLKYLANMAVRSSMSISINSSDRLWGLIACHAYGLQGRRVSFPTRKMCRLIGDAASRNIERLSRISRLQARQLISTAPKDKNQIRYIIASSDDLIKLFDADFGLVSIQGEAKILGKLEKSQEALVMLEYLRLRKITSVTSSQDIREDFPDLFYSPGFKIIAGLLLVPLSVDGNDFIVFFRKEQVKEVKWAGNPYEKIVKEGTDGFLEPRKSFKTWSEIIVGKCRDWSEEQMETAAILCLLYGKFIEIWRQKKAALQNSQLTRLLLTNSAHELRTPLNAIINYLEIAMEGSLDQETRDNLAKSHSASKSLIYVINDLLDLTKAEEGLELIRYDLFDFPNLLLETTEVFKADAKRKGLKYDVCIDPKVSRIVLGDQRRLRQAITNLIANAIKFTTQGYVHVEAWLLETLVDKATIEVLIQDSGCGMSDEKVDDLFRDLEQVTVESSSFDSKIRSSFFSLPQETRKRTLGLGLAIVSRIIWNMNGQLRLKSEEGVGSCFVIQITFDLPGAENKSVVESPRFISEKRSISTLQKASEITLIDRISPQPASGTGKLKINGNSNVKKLEIISRQIKNSDSENDHHLQDQRIGQGKTQIPLMHLNPNQRCSNSPQLYDISSSIDKNTSEPRLKCQNGPSSRSTQVLDEYLASRAQIKSVKNPNAFHLKILVAEDDPINSKIIHKRLVKSGHEVYHTINGEDCANVFAERGAYFDVILMDLQMPIVDGLLSTRMIRSFERANPQRSLSKCALLNGRVPIFAVSASLHERELQTYIETGFDGWVLKPIDFKRLHVLLLGLIDDTHREASVYHPGQWEKGGWFNSCHNPDCNWQDQE